MPILTIDVVPAEDAEHHTASTSRSRATHNYFVDGVMVHNSPETTPGGRALKFYSSVRLDIRRIESHQGRRRDRRQPDTGQGREEQGGPAVQAGRVRHHVRPGISREGALLDIGVDLGLVKKSGAWYTYEGEQLGQGRENAKTFLAENTEVMVEISEKVRKAAGIGRARRGRHDQHDRADAPGLTRRSRRRPRRPPHHPGLIHRCDREGGRALAVALGPVTVGDQAVPRSHLRVPDERARLRTHRRSLGVRRHGSGRQHRGRRRHRAQHVLHPGERRQQALRHPRPPQVTEGSQSWISRSSSVAAWPRRIGSRSASGHRTSMWCSAPTTLGGRQRCCERSRIEGQVTEIVEAGELDDHEAFPSALPVPPRGRSRGRGCRSRWGATTAARSASCPRCGAPRCRARSTTSWPRSSGWPPTVSPR